MKVWIDARIYSQNNKDLLKAFVLELSKKNTINLYISDYIDLEQNENITIKYIKKSGFYYTNTSFVKKLKKDKNDLVITFEHTFPLSYNKNVYKIIDSLEYILYPDFVWKTSLSKHFLLFLYKNILKKSKKIIALNNQIKWDLNEHYNIKDDKINVIDWFFVKIPNIVQSWMTPVVNVKNKHWILWDYLISDVWVWNAKNLKKLIDAISILDRDMNLVFLWDEISKNLEIRDYVISKKMQNKTFFVWTLAEKEEEMYYKQSSWIIFTWNYLWFPTFLNKALSYNVFIYTSDLVEIKSILKENWIYFSPDKIKDIVWKLNINSLHQIDYKEIFKNYDVKKFVKNLLELIK